MNAKLVHSKQSVHARNTSGDVMLLFFLYLFYITIENEEINT